MRFQYGEKYQRQSDGKVFEVVDHVYSGIETVTRDEGAVVVLEQVKFRAILQSQTDMERLSLADDEAQEFELWELPVE